MEILQTVLSSVTTVAALIAACAAIIAPIKTASIEAKTQVKLKELDLYQAEKSKAYKQLTEALGAYRQDPTPYDGNKLYEAISLASIYSSDETAEKLLHLAGSLLASNQSNSTNLYIEAMSAMRGELAKILEPVGKVENRKNSHNKS